ncbi:MAG: hypothetical protein ABI658_05320 [Acidimicrobiales bacterium]
MNNKRWLVPLTGLLFLLLAIVGFAVGGQPKDAGHPAQEIADHYIDNKGSIILGAAILGVAAVVLVFFAGYLRTVMYKAEGGGGMLSSLVLAGASIMAVGVAVDVSLLFAIAEAADDIEPTSVQTLQAFWDNDFMPMAVGLVIFLLSAGIAIARYGVLPKWLGWVAIVLAVAGITPLGFFAFLAGGLWIGIVSVLLALRERRPDATSFPTNIAVG